MNLELNQIIEIIGYVGSALVIISMLMTSVVKLRIINMTGSVIFAVYALCIHSYPTAAMQAALIIINIVSLYKLLGAKKEYSIVKSEPGDAFASFFLDKYKDDIKKIFPDFTLPAAGSLLYLICCHSDCAGILIGTLEPDDTLCIQLDYTTPAYRDASVGKFLYAWLATQGIKNLKATAPCPIHERYLKKMGFKNTSGSFEKSL